MWLQDVGDRTGGAGEVCSVYLPATFAYHSQVTGEPFPHLVMYSISATPSLQESLPTELMRGLFEVTEINGWDEDNGVM